MFQSSCQTPPFIADLSLIRVKNLKVSRIVHKMTEAQSQFSKSFSSKMESNDDNSNNYVLNDQDLDILIDSIDVDEMNRQEEEANSRLEEELRNEYQIPPDEEVNWASLARFSQKMVDKNRERIQEQKEQQRQFELYLQDIRDEHERQLYIDQIYQEQIKIEE